MFVLSFLLFSSDLRKRSTLSEGEEPEVHYPFVFNPFTPPGEGGQPRLSGQSIFVSPDPSVVNNNNAHQCLPVLKELYHFGEGFIERWADSLAKSRLSDPNYDPVFMEVEG